MARPRLNLSPKLDVPYKFIYISTDECDVTLVAGAAIA
jgi:hypothetical protein